MKGGGARRGGATDQSRAGARVAIPLECGLEFFGSAVRIRVLREAF